MLKSEIDDVFGRLRGELMETFVLRVPCITVYHAIRNQTFDPKVVGRETGISLAGYLTDIFVRNGMQWGLEASCKDLKF